MKHTKFKIRFNSLHVLIDDITNYIISILKKFKEFITNKKASGILKLTIKLLVLFIIIWLLNIPFYLINKLGIVIIDSFSSTFNEIIGRFWTILVSYTYIITSILIIYDTFISILKDEEIEIILNDKKKNKKTKDKLFLPIIKGIKIIVLIFLVPLVLMLIILFMSLGALIGLTIQGISIYSLYLILIGLIIITISITSLLFNWMFIKNKEVRG